MKIEPMPPQQGMGFSSRQAVDGLTGYRLVETGPYFNYHFTTENYQWPERVAAFPNVVIDGFSPNLNKKLHIGHLRNLVVGSSLAKILEAKAVSLLGASMGIDDGALESYGRWLALSSYEPKYYLDTSTHGTLHESLMIVGVGEYEGCKVWIGPNGPIVLIRADGRPTYAYHDLAFAQTVKPDFYVTAYEQSSHFKALGLDSKHLPMGLVCGLDGKKLSSRNGNAITAREALFSVLGNVREGDGYMQLGWNVIAWNFASVGRAVDIRFNPTDWAKVERPGMYITYTYARVKKALGSDVEKAEIEERDLPIVGTASYCDHFLNRARLQYDPSPLANYALRLAKCLTKEYDGEERLATGRPSFRYAMSVANETLGRVMSLLTMYPLDKIGQ